MAGDHASVIAGKNRNPRPRIDTTHHLTRRFGANKGGYRRESTQMRQMSEDATGAGTHRTTVEQRAQNAPSGDLGRLLGEPAGRRAPRRRLVAIIAVIVVVALAGLLWSMMSGGGAAYRFTTAPVTTGDLTVTVTATGSIQPTEKVDVSSELSGRIRSVNVDYNSPVKAGDVLAELVTDNLDAAVASAEAKLAEAGIQLMRPRNPGRGIDGNRGMWIADPDGNQIEIMEMAPNCIQYEAERAVLAGGKPHVLSLS